MYLSIILLPIEIVVVGIVNDVNFVNENATGPIVVTLVGILIDIKFEQTRNAAESMLMMIIEILMTIGMITNFYDSSRYYYRGKFYASFEGTIVYVAIIMLVVEIVVQ